MAQVIREAKIVIHLEQGRVELKAPDLSAYLKQLDAQLQQTKQIERETTAAAAAQEHLNKATSGFRIITEKPTLQPHIAAQLPPELGGTLGVEGIRQTTQATQERAQSEAALARELKARAAAEREAANSPFGRGLANLKTESFDRGLLVMQQQRQQAAAAAAAAAAQRQAAEQAAAAQLPQLGPGNAAGARIAAQIKEQAAEQRRLNDAIAEGARLEAEQGAEAVQRHQQAAAAVQAQQQAQEQANERVRQSQMQLLRSSELIGVGMFRIGRAAVLLGTGTDESFQKMIRNLAIVQAGFDLYKGTSQIVRGVVQAIEAMRKAQEAATAATLVATTATRAQTVATAGLMTVLGPVVGVLAVLGVGYALWRQRTLEQAEAERELKDAILERHRAQQEEEQQAFSRLEESTQALTAQRVGMLIPAGRLAAMRREVEELRAMQRLGEELSGGFRGPARTAAQAEHLANMADLRRQELQLIQSGQGDREHRGRVAEHHKQILVQRQRELEIAIQIRDVEKQKAESFQLQFALLSRGRQVRLEGLVGRAEEGQITSRRQLEELANFFPKLAEKAAGQSGLAPGAGDLFNRVQAFIGEAPGGAQAQLDVAQRRVAEAASQAAQSIIDRVPELSAALTSFVDEVIKQVNEGKQKAEANGSVIGKLTTAALGLMGR